MKFTRAVRLGGGSVVRRLGTLFDAWMGTRSSFASAAEPLPVDPPEAYCHRCGGSVTAALSTCLQCPRMKVGADRIVRVGEYAGALRHHVHQLKYDPGDWRNARLIAEAMGRAVSGAGAWSQDPPVVVPVPMPIMRRLLRGVDHAGLLARAVASMTGGSVVQPFRRRRSPLQAGFSTVHQRMREGGRGFLLRSGSEAWRKRIEGRSVLVVDDVLTTGTTAARLIRRLRRLRPRVVWLVVVGVRSWSSPRRSVPTMPIRRGGAKKT